MSTYKVKSRRKIKKKTMKRYKKQKTIKKRNKKSKSIRRKSIKKSKRRKKRGGMERDPAMRPGQFPMSVGNNISDSDSLSGQDTIIDSVSGESDFTYEILEEVAQKLDDCLSLFLDVSQLWRNNIENLSQSQLEALRELPDKLEVDGKNIFSNSYYSDDYNPVVISLRLHFLNQHTNDEVSYLFRMYEKIVKMYFFDMYKDGDSMVDEAEYFDEQGQRVVSESLENIGKLRDERLNEIRSNNSLPLLPTRNLALDFPTN